MAEMSNGLPRMMVGFIVRRCAVELGHAPNAAEFASWANNREMERGRYCLFGRPITEHEAQVILAHQGRLVSARGALLYEQFSVPGEPPTDPPQSGAAVVSLRQARKKTTPPLRDGGHGAPKV